MGSEMCIRDSLCSRDRHGQVFRHMASAAPIFSAAGEVTFIRVTTCRISTASEVRQLPPLTLPDALKSYCADSTLNLSSSLDGFEGGDFPQTPTSMGISAHSSSDELPQRLPPTPGEPPSPGALSEALSEPALWCPIFREGNSMVTATTPTWPTGISDLTGPKAGACEVANVPSTGTTDAEFVQVDLGKAGADRLPRLGLLSTSGCGPLLDCSAARASAPRRTAPVPVSPDPSAPPPSVRQKPSGWLGTLEALASLGGSGLLGGSSRSWRTSTKPGRAVRADAAPSHEACKQARVGITPPISPAIPVSAAPAAPCTGARHSSDKASQMEHFLARLSLFVPPPEPYPDGYIVVTSATAPYVVEWASAGWLRLCGFRPSGLDILGRSLSCIQGPLTDHNGVRRMSRCIRERRDSRRPVRLINYDSAGVPFVHSVRFEYLPAKHGRDGCCGAAFRATSSDVLLHPKAAERWLEETENKSRQDSTDFWCDDFEEYMGEWAERIQGKSVKVISEVGNRGK